MKTEKESYFEFPYEKKGRFASYWHQIQEIAETGPDTILEIGVGNRFVSNYLTSKGFGVVTMDIKANFHPSICGSIVDTPFKSGCFDVVACYEVLEHLPYKVFPNALKELCRIAKNRVVISVPDSTSMYRFWIQIPKIGDIQKLISLPFKRERLHVFDGEHYWEIGRKGFAVKKIKEHIRACGFKILKTYRVFEFYHRFFVLEKRMNTITNHEK